jgi:hypothetical protein
MPKLFNKAKVNSIRTLEAISGFLKIVWIFFHSLFFL